MSDTSKDVVRIFKQEGQWRWERKTANGQINGNSHRRWASRKDAENNARKVCAAPASFKVVE
ncbi:hypothetical protein G4X40_19880 [Rhodococcus sp. D2-41]|uniref:hypothetical protein n=1 Tax=Speluncibacter jeojiensis TaxID=2710754 RepID=UPI0024107567|nr:hypothetical protein [Rhodococcus sp. D2-41]MDG3012404.1 hypothetical protein [Rhodococcus sp. D2-41]